MGLINSATEKTLTGTSVFGKLEPPEVANTFNMTRGTPRHDEMSSFITPGTNGFSLAAGTNAVAVSGNFDALGALGMSPSQITIPGAMAEEATRTANGGLQIKGVKTLST